MRDRYHEELDQIAASLVEMAYLVGTAVDRATHALLDADLELAESVMSGDLLVDSFYREIERDAADVFARQQPVARDLRLLVASLRIVSELERMGDLAKHLAKVARRRYPGLAIPVSVEPTMREMGQVAHRIVSKCAKVLEFDDARLAAELEHDDDVMDALHRRVFSVLLDPQFDAGMECAIDVTLCGRYYERFCDHAVSVAQHVTYLLTGVHPHARIAVAP